LASELVVYPLDADLQKRRGGPARLAVPWEQNVPVPLSANRSRRGAKLWLHGLLLLFVLATVWPVVVDPRTRQLAANTLWLVGSVVALSLSIGVTLALLIVRTDLPGRKPALLILTVLMFLPLYMQAAGWQAGFGLQGWYTLWASGHTLLQGFAGAIWVHTVATIPWVVILVGIGLWRAEPELEEAALVDFSPFDVLVRVTLRRAAPAVAIAALWIALLTAGDMTVTNLFLVRTYAEEVYTQMAQGGDPGTQPLGLLPGMLGTAWLLLAGLLLAGELAAHGRFASQRRPLVFYLGGWRAGAAALVWAALLLLAGVPLGNLVYKAGWLATHTSAGWQHGWSDRRFLEVIAGSPGRFGRELGWTLLLAALAAGVALAIGIPLAWSARRGRRARAITWLITAGCLALPGPIVGLSIIWLFERSDHPLAIYLYDRTLLAPLMAQVVRGLPLATIVLWQALSTVPDELLDAAAVDGATPAVMLRELILPAQLPALAAAGLVAFAVAASDLAATILVVPPGIMTLPIQIFNLIHGGVDDLVAGICLTLLAGYALIALAVVQLAKRFGATS
jgi:iron(III) transport system permease protein